MESLCQVHKNRQITVDFMSDILLDQGMDARKMKKVIQEDAMNMYHNFMHDKYKIAIILGLEMDTECTEAVRARYERVTRQMYQQAVRANSD